MAKFELTNKAVSDLNGIWEYTFEKWSERQANKYYRELIDCCQKLVDSPQPGKIIRVLQTPYRDLN